jgi:hypothetical protein
MSAQRLILKQPTGWFAAGREFAQALTLLSDGAFKLYVHTCLRANRHTGCLGATLEELARALGRAPEVIARDLAELEDRAVCRVSRDGNSSPVLGICDRFWPYQRQPTSDRVLGQEAEFVQKVRSLFLAPACVQASFAAADEKVATNLHRRGVSLEQVRQAILLGCARKYSVMINTGARAPITSLQYFSAIIEEVTDSVIPGSYWEHLQHKVAEMQRQWQQAATAKTMMP